MLDSGRTCHNEQDVQSLYADLIEDDEDVGLYATQESQKVRFERVSQQFFSL